MLKCICNVQYSCGKCKMFCPVLILLYIPFLLPTASVGELELVCVCCWEYIDLFLSWLLT
jgi:hypothetical protein